MNLIKASTGLITATVLTLATQVQAISIFSDDFNSEHGGVGTLNYNGFANWTVTSGTVDLIGNGFFDFYPGNGLYVDLDGSTSQAGTMVSKVITVGPGNYLLSFALGGNHRGFPTDTVNVNVNLGFASQTYNLASGDPLTTETIAFTVSSPTTIDLSFQNLGGDNVGAILDNVNLNSVPDGGATVGLLWAGLVAISAIQRRMK